MNLSNNTDFNDTLLLEQRTVNASVIKLVHDVLIISLLLLIMFAMGCLITVQEIFVHLRRPVGVGIGMLSQFVVLPLTAFCLINVFSLNPLQGTGVLILATSPGGVTSNVFTYFSDGDVSLSVSMTTCSTVLAMVMMPANLWIYGQHLENRGSIVIPYAKIAISLVSVTTPVALGMLVKWKKPRLANFCSKLGAYSGFALIILSQILEFIIYPDIFSTVTWHLYATLCVLPGVSLSLGYFLAFAFRQPSKIRRTIAMECSLQNIGIALTLISLSFALETQKAVIAFSYLYHVPMLLSATVAVGIFQIYKKYFAKNVDPVPDKDNETNGHLMEYKT